MEVLGLCVSGIWFVLIPLQAYARFSKKNIATISGNPGREDPTTLLLFFCFFGTSSGFGNILNW